MTLCISCHFHAQRGIVLLKGKILLSLCSQGPSSLPYLQSIPGAKSGQRAFFACSTVFPSACMQRSRLANRWLLSLGLAMHSLQPNAALQRSGHAAWH